MLRDDFLYINLIVFWWWKLTRFRKIRNMLQFTVSTLNSAYHALANGLPIGINCIEQFHYFCLGAHSPKPIIQRVSINLIIFNKMTNFISQPNVHSTQVAYSGVILYRNESFSNLVVCRVTSRIRLFKEKCESVL